MNFGAPHRRQAADGSRAWASKDGAWIVGLHDRHQLTEAAGERQFMVASFTPIGAHRFLRLPMHRSANQALDLALIDPALARTVRDRVGTRKNWSDRFAAMESLIAERVLQSEVSAVDLSWRRLVAADGRIALRQLAADADCSHRSLIAEFRKKLGLPPKTIARLLRFNRARRLLGRFTHTPQDEATGKPYIVGESPSRLTARIPWAGIAADCGYFDQAHFIKEFRQFAGYTPAAFVKLVSDQS